MPTLASVAAPYHPSLSGSTVGTDTEFYMNRGLREPLLHALRHRSPSPSKSGSSSGGFQTPESNRPSSKASFTPTWRSPLHTPSSWQAAQTWDLPTSRRPFGNSLGAVLGGARGLPWRLPTVPPSTILCCLHIFLSCLGPILFDWVKRRHNGHFAFSVPSLTFYAWSAASALGLFWTVSRYGFEGALRRLWRPDMLWRFCITSAMFTVGDLLSFWSMQRMDVGTFSLLGKSVSIAITMVLSSLVLERSHTRLQHILVAVITVGTMVFCEEEHRARNAPLRGNLKPLQTTAWMVGILQRIGAVTFYSLGAVLQEIFFTREKETHFMMQQCWMGVGAVITSFAMIMCFYGDPMSFLTIGFDDWTVWVLVTSYVVTGMATGLVVKRLGALAKALCVPIYLGFCHGYAVHSGSAVLTLPVLASWCLSTLCVLWFAATKAQPHAAKPAQK